MAEKRSFWERIAYKELTQRGTKAQDELHILSETERERLSKVRKNTLLKAGLAGALGVILLFAPYHIFGSKIFPETDVWIPLYNGYIPIEIEYYIFSFVLLFIEIWFLTYINIKGTADIADACGYPPLPDENYDENINELISVGLEKKQKKLKSIGIDPYEGLSKWKVFLYQTIVRLKAMISGILFKILIRRLLGRYAVRAVVDFAGIPVYAFWNAYASHKILTEARVRILAPALINRFKEKLYSEYSDDLFFRTHLFEYLQSISVSKRGYHYNHYLLSTSLMERFDIEINKSPLPYEKLFILLETRSQRERVAFSKLFAFGMLIDGKLSPRESIKINGLFDRNILPYEYSQLKQWSDDFYEGRGLESFFDFEPSFKGLTKRSQLDQALNKVLNDPAKAGGDLAKGVGNLAGKGVSKGVDGVAKGVDTAGNIAKGVGNLAGKGITKGAGGVAKGVDSAGNLVKGFAKKTGITKSKKD